MTEVLVVHSGPLSMEVIPSQAGRVGALLFQGRNLLCGPEVHPENWGATYWTSPQSDWGWPPVAEVDSLPYELLEGEPGVQLRSPVAEFGGRRLVIEKHFRPGPQGSIDVEYVIENRGDSEFRMASWEISRVGPGGLTFFPTGEAELTPILPHAELETVKAHGATFYDHSAFEVGKCRKLHADGRGGYLAHVEERGLVLKLFRDSLPDEQAPGEGECEIFANDDGKYVEIEVQGPYARIEPGARSGFVVRTLVQSLPEGVSREDFRGLLEFAGELARVHAV